MQNRIQRGDGAKKRSEHANEPERKSDTRMTSKIRQNCLITLPVGKNLDSDATGTNLTHGKIKEAELRDERSRFMAY